MLAKKRILVVEDEVLVALEIMANLEAEGAVPVGPCSSVAEALRTVETDQLDAALLDANLRGATVEQIAAALTRRNVPFAFVTGYARESLPRAFASAPVISKPFIVGQLLEETRRLVSRSGAPAISLRKEQAPSAARRN